MFIREMTENNKPPLPPKKQKQNNNNNNNNKIGMVPFIRLQNDKPKIKRWKNDEKWNGARAVILVSDSFF